MKSGTTSTIDGRRKNNCLDSTIVKTITINIERFKGPLFCYICIVENTS